MSLFQLEGEENLVRQCMTNKRKAEEIIDSLGLSHRSSGRAKPVFDDPTVQHLYKLVSGAVALCTNSSTKTATEILQDLSKDEAIMKSVDDICDSVGQKIWGIPSKKHLLTPGANFFYPKHLLWDNERHREEIKAYIRCWIIKRASRRLGDETRKRKDASKPSEQTSPSASKGKSSARIVSGPDDATSDEEESSSTSRPDTPVTAARTVLRPPLPRSPPISTLNRGVAPLQAGEVGSATVNEVDNNDDNTSHANVPSVRQKKTSNPSPSEINKRKRSDFESNLRGKLSKPTIDWRRKLPENPKNRPGDIYSVPGSSPSPIFSAGPVNTSFGRRRRMREPTEESDPSWRPTRELSVDRESEAISDVDQRMNNTFDDLLRPEASSTATMSEFQQLSRPFRISSPQESIIFGDAQMLQVTSRPETSPIGINIDLDHNDNDNRSVTLAPWPTFQFSYTEKEEREYRRELFQLLLARLNNLEEFEPGRDHRPHDERLNHLLQSFFVNESNRLQSTFDDRFVALQMAFEAWMEMREKLSVFRSETNYTGGPGEDWKQFLRRISPERQRAEALLKHAKLHSSDTVIVTGAQFNEDLMIIFHELTRYPGGNGVEEFGGIKSYNETLLAWFEH